MKGLLVERILRGLVRLGLGVLVGTWDAGVLIGVVIAGSARTPVKRLSLCNAYLASGKLEEGLRRLGGQAILAIGCFDHD